MANAPLYWKELYESINSSADKYVEHLLKYKSGCSFYEINQMIVLTQLALLQTE